MDMLKICFIKLKALALQGAMVSFYVIKRKVVNRNASYMVFHVNVDEKLQNKLRDTAARKVCASNDVREYDFSTTDLDDDVLGIETSETDMQNIITSITNDNKTMQARKVEDLYDAWMYIARLELNNSPSFYFARQISGSWNMKKALSVSNILWKEQILMDVSEDKLFRIDKKVDFFAFDGFLFIADKKNFETALNFRLGMENNRDQIITEFLEKNVVDDPEKMKALVGNNVIRLRKLSQIKKSGYYNDPKYLKELRTVNKNEGWGLVYNKSGEIVVTDENIDKVLRLLNNGRLTSKVNGETFDVDVKHKL